MPVKNVCVLTCAALLSASVLSVFGDVPSTTENFSYKREGVTKALSEMVQGGKIVLGDGTFVYEGEDGATLDYPITNAVEDVYTKGGKGQTGYYKAIYQPKGLIYDIHNDLILPQGIKADQGAFIKTGPGTLWLPTANSLVVSKRLPNRMEIAEDGSWSENTSSYSNPTISKPYPFVAQENGTAPADGFALFNVFGGGLRLGTADTKKSTAVWTLDQKAPSVYLGGLSAQTGEQEPDVLVELMGGKVTMNCTVVLGYLHGLSKTTPNGPAKAVLRIHENGYWATGGGKYFTMGDNSTTADFAGRGCISNEIIRVEVLGGEFNFNSGLSAGYSQYSSSEIFCSNGVVRSNTLTWNSGVAYSSAPFVRTGYRKHAVSTLDFVGPKAKLQTGVVIAGNVDSTSYDYASTYLNFSDGATLEVACLTNGGNRAAHTVNRLTLDGGILHEQPAVSPADHFVDGRWEIRLGTAGGTIAMHNTDKVHPILAAIASAEGVTDGGLVIAADDDAAVLELTKASTYVGPTVLQKGILRFADEGSLPNEAALELAGGTLEVASDVTVASLQLSATSGLVFTKGAKLVVTDSLTVAEPTVVEVAMTGATKGDKLDIIQVPEASAVALANLIFHTADGSALAVIGKTVTTAGGVATLTAEFDDPRTMDASWTNPAGGAWATAANWDGEIVPHVRPGVKATFATVATSDGTAVTLDGAKTLGSLILSATKGYDFRNGSFVFDNDGLGGEIAVSGGGEWRVSSALTLNEDTEVNLAAQTDSITLAGVIGGAGRLLLSPGKAKTQVNRFTGAANAATDPSKIVARGATYIADAGEDTETTIGGFAMPEGTDSVRLMADGALTLTKGIAGADFDAGVKPYLYLLGEGLLTFGSDSETAVWNWYQQRGDVVVKGKLTCGGNLYLPQDDGTSSTANTKPTSMVVDGGEVKTYNFSFNGYPTETGVQHALVITNGGTVTVGGNFNVPKSKTVSGKSIQLGKVTIADGRLDVVGSMNLSNDANTGARVELLEGGTLRALTLSGASTINVDQVTYTGLEGSGLYADGGTVEFFSQISQSSYVWHGARIYLGAKGLVIDMSHMRDSYDKIQSYYCGVRGGFFHDPALGAAKDGGIRLRGDGLSYAILYYFYDTISDFTGDFTVEDGGHVALGTHYNDKDGKTKKAMVFCHPFVMEPGSILSIDGDASKYTPVVPALTLGKSGATKPLVVRCTAGAKAVAKVTGALTVLSSVVVGVGKDSDESAPLVAGTYPVFYYDKASNPSVDLSLFRGISTPGFRASFAEQTGSGEFAGLTAIVMTVVADASVVGDRKWTSTQTGGAWSNTANWENEQVANDSSMVVQFAPAAEEKVPVTVDGDFAVGALDFDAATDGNGYTLGGTGTLDFNGPVGARITTRGGVGRLDTAIADYVGAVVVQTYRGATQHFGRAALAGVKGILSCGDGLGQSMVGLVVLDDTSAFTGRLYCGYNAIELSSFDFVTHPNQLVQRYGLLRYTGDSTTLDGFTSDEGTSSFSAFEVAKAGTTVTINGNVARGNGSNFLKTGPGSVVLGGTAGFEWKSARAGAGSWSADTGTPQSGICPLQVAEGLVTVGAAGDSANAPFVQVVGCQPSGGTNYCIAVGTGRKAGNPVLRLENGTLNGTNSIMQLGYQGLNDPASVYTYEQNGGVLKVGSVEMGNGTSTGADWLDVKPTKRFIVNGGVAEVAGTFGLGADAGKATLELNGGELTAETIVPMTVRNGKTYTGTVKFNGGTFAPTGSDMAGGTRVEVGANGGMLSTDKVRGESFTLATALLGAGTLVKTGAKTLVIDAEVAPTTTVAVAGGTVAVGPNADWKGAAKLAGGMLAADGRTLGFIVGEGTVAGDVMVHGFKPVAADAPTLEFTGTLTIATTRPTLDLSAYQGAIQLGAAIPLAKVASVVGLSAKAKIVGVDGLRSGVRGVLRVEGNVLYADLTEPGSCILVR